MDKLVRRFVLSDHPVQRADITNFIRVFALDKKDR